MPDVGSNARRAMVSKAFEVGGPQALDGLRGLLLE